jgi:hypothetical protein
MICKLRVHRAGGLYMESVEAIEEKKSLKPTDFETMQSLVRKIKKLRRP